MSFIKKGKLYYCPYDCGDSRYPQQKWKTEKGAQKHVDNCHMRPEEVKKRDDVDIEQKKEDLKKRSEQLDADNEKLKSAKYKIGDRINFVHKWISKTTHDYRGNRLVKVRYEEEYSFSARAITVKKVACFEGRIMYNDICYEPSIEVNFKDAEIKASLRQASHLESNKHSSDLR